MRMGGHNSRTVLASVIAGIFAATTVGVWYDPSDFSSMYQDSVGVTQVTAVGQPVGLMLDKSKGLVRSAELVGNGDFSDGTTGWTPGTGWSVTGGRAEVSNAGAASHLVSTVANGTVITVGKFYEITYDVQVTAGAIQMDCGGGTAPAANSPIGPVTRRAIVRATAGFGFRVYGNATAVGWVDNISVKEIPGNHILQATTTARPVLTADSNGLRYLNFDGVDDYMSTPTVISLGSISTFDVSCAVAREQSAAIAVIAEYGNGGAAPDGAFAVFGPLTAGTESYLFRVRGTVTVQSAANYPLGVPVVLTARTVINSGFVMRYNAGTVATNATSQAGALTDQQMWIGARSGGSLPFDGRFYGLMIFGRRLASNETFFTERYLGQKSGVFV